MKQKVIAIVGPTASGKTALSIYLAQKLGGEILSADSRQVYKGLDLGTGKVTKREMAGIPHFGLDIASPKKQFSAGDFVEYGTHALSMINNGDKLPVVVGGTGFYVDALLGKITLPDAPPNPALREKLEKKSVEQLFKQLEKLDPTRAKIIEPKHKRRLIRAIEIALYKAAQKSLPVHLGSSQRSHPGISVRPYQVLWLGLNPNEKTLKQKIAARLRERLKAGMLGEAKKLHTGGLSYKRMGELGLEYRSLARLLQGKITKAKFLEELDRAIWHYVKRQNRWFKRNKDIIWVANRAKALRLAKEFIAR